MRYLSIIGVFMSLAKKIDNFEIAVKIMSKDAQQGFANSPIDIQKATESMNAMLVPLTAAAQSGVLTSQMVMGLSSLQSFLNNPMLKQVIVNGLKNFAQFLTDPNLVAAAKQALPQLANIFNAKPQAVHKHPHKQQVVPKTSAINVLEAKYGQSKDESKADDLAANKWQCEQMAQYYGIDPSVCVPKPKLKPATKPIVKKPAVKPVAKPSQPTGNVMNDSASQPWLKDVLNRQGPTVAYFDALTKKYGK